MSDLETVVSGGTEQPVAETPAASTTSTQAAETPVSESTPAETTTDWRSKQREDAALNAHIQSEIARAIAKRERAALKATAKSAVDSENVESALEVARRIAAEPDDVDEDAAHDRAWATKADKVQPHLERMFKLDAQGRATNPHYVKLHQSVGQAEMDRRYAADPEAFYDWADEKIQDMRLDEAVKRVAPGMAKAIAQDETHRALQGAPSPLTGGTGGSSAVTLSQYNADPALRAKLRSTPEGRKQIDAMTRA